MLLIGLEEVVRELTMSEQGPAIEGASTMFFVGTEVSQDFRKDLLLISAFLVRMEKWSTVTGSLPKIQKVGNLSVSAYL